MKIGEKIKQLRVQSEMTQHSLAVMLDMTDKAVAYYEAGLRMPPTARIIELANIFNVTPNYLLDDGANITALSTESSQAFLDYLFKDDLVILRKLKRLRVTVNGNIMDGARKCIMDDDDKTLCRLAIKKALQGIH